MSKQVLLLRDIKKSYRQGKESLHVLNGIDLEIKEGEAVEVTAPPAPSEKKATQ